MPRREFWEGRRVLLTGHTGFKGAWSSVWLSSMGAQVYGYALPADTTPNLIGLVGGTVGLSSHIGDVRDLGRMRDVVAKCQPQIVIHMAAQALVRRSYRDPIGTFGANVMGTANLLEALRDLESVEAILVVTSDKTYENSGGGRAHREDDRLGGADPYSASKAACELIASCYRESYFASRGIPLATARAGNVIGGGDWSEDRLVPDLWRAARAGRTVELRHPQATRPWQHVLDAVGGYFAYLEKLVEAPRGTVTPTLNFGPIDGPAPTVAEVAERFHAAFGVDEAWRQAPGEHPPEQPTLAIDARRAREVLGWSPHLTVAETLDWTAEWYAAYDKGADMAQVTMRQIQTYQDRLL